MAVARAHLAGARAGRQQVDVASSCCRPLFPAVAAGLWIGVLF